MIFEKKNLFWIGETDQSDMTGLLFTHNRKPICGRGLTTGFRMTVRQSCR